MNQKGGVGKTTTTLNLSHALALEGQKILMLDMDPQGHLGSCFGVNTDTSEGMDEVLLEGRTITDVMQGVRENLFLVPAGARLGEIETSPQGTEQTEAQQSKMGYQLFDALSVMQRSDFDFILVDCPPASGLLAMNAILACNEFLVPVTGDYLALQGLSRLIKVVTHIEQALNKNIQKWFVLTRYQKQRKLAQQIRHKLVNYFPHRIFETAIRENVSLAESPGFAKTIFEYKPRSNGAEDYRKLAIDLLEDRTLN